MILQAAFGSYSHYLSYAGLYTLFTEPLSILLFLLAAQGEASLGKRRAEVSFPTANQRDLELPPAIEAKDTGCWFALFYYLWVCLLFVMMTMIIYSYCI